MPHRHAVAGVSVLVLIALLLATFANTMAVANTWQVRKNCHRIQTHSERTRGILMESLTPLKEGKLDDDYRRFFGPEAKARKDAAIARLEHQIAEFKPIDCTPLVIQWAERIF